jgi:predicted transcriptional regulator
MSNVKAPASPSLGPLESAVLDLLWRNGTLTSSEVRERLGPERGDLNEATVRTVLRRLESKGLVQHKVSGRTYRYRCAESPREMAVRAVEEAVARYCGGDMETLLEALIEAGLVGRRDLKKAGKRH